jgi:chromosome partitioning protein
MKTISIINLKGGVGKTVSAINIAYVLAAVHGARVLLVDCDKQGNVSKFFRLHGDDVEGIAELLTVKNADINALIKHTEYSGLDVITANMNLLNANKEILLDMTRPQQTRLKKAFAAIKTPYDYCVIDNAPDINMSVINALVATNDVLVPIKIDKFAFDGLEQLTEQIESVKEFNPDLNLRGCFVTLYQQNNINAQGSAWLESNTDYPLFKTFIRKTVKVDETTFNGKPLLNYSKNCTAARDYENLVAEYLSM